MRGAGRAIFATLVSIAGLALTRPAAATCGFYAAPAGPSMAGSAELYNDADAVVIVREGTRMSLTMSTNYLGPPADFAMVVPVPVVLQKESVETLPHHVFKRLEQLTAPRLEEAWEEDPCPPPVEISTGDDKSGGTGAKAKGAEGSMGGGAASNGVTIEAEFVTGEYEILVLGAEESDGLERWLHEHHYNVPRGASAALAPYIKEQQKFVVAKVDVKKVKMDARGAMVLSPLRFTYEANDLRMPVRLGLLNAKGKQDLIVYLIGKTRFEVANYGNAFIPTYVDVTEATRTDFGSFYAALFDATMLQAGGKAVVTEYVGDADSCLAPCPTARLEADDLAWLGVDPSSSPSTLVLTRLHTRYDATTLSEDLVFRAASPVEGVAFGTDGATTSAASTTGHNEFVADYVIRYRWEGDLSCSDPKLGHWGGASMGGGAPIPAVELAAVPRVNLDLASFVASPVPELRMKMDAPTFGSPTNPAALLQRRKVALVLHYAIYVLATGLVVIGIVVALRRRRRGPATTG